MAASVSSVTVYDFLSPESATLWRGLLQPALRKIQKQVHPRLEISDEAVGYLEELIFRLLAQICAASPHVLQDVEAYVQKNFAAPIDTWALSDAQMMMGKHAAKKKGVFVFPVDQIYQQLQREVFVYKIELNVIQYTMAILDYVSADILKLAGNFVKNTRKPAICTTPPDIKVSMSADPALQTLFQPLQSGGHTLVKDLAHSFLETETPLERRSMSYDDLLRDLMDEEQQYIRHLNLILKVFREPFLARSDLFMDFEVSRIFGNLQELLELSVQMMSSLDECIEMAGELEGDEGHPQAGFVFEDLAESEEFAVYSTYAENYMEAMVILEEMLAQTDVIEYFKSLQPMLFKEAMQYLLPKMLLEPIYHCFYYFEVMGTLEKSSPSGEDQDALRSAMACMLRLKMEMETQCARFLPKRKEDASMFGRRPGYQISLKKMAQLQEKIEGWEGPDISSSCTEFITEGALGVMREGARRSQKTERHVFLLDGLVVCCKQNVKRGPVEEYRLKEKMNMRKVKLRDLEEADDLKFAFLLVEPDQPGIIFYTISKPDKNEWMAALTLLLTRSTFDRMLDAKLREEELTIPALRPSPDQYKFAEEDSDENIMFDDLKDRKGVSSGPGPLIKAGTIYKLVERLTYHEYADPTFVRTFLATYRSFSKPLELLDLLIERFQIPQPLDVDDLESRRDHIMMKAHKRFKLTYVSPIQLRVLNVLRHWVEFHYYDFEREPLLLEKLKDFVDSVKSKNMQKWVSSIHRALQKKEDEAQPSSTKPVFDRDPDAVEWHLTRNRDDYNLLTLHPVEVARQLTLIQSEYFRAIHPSELVDASWMKEGRKEEASPHLLRLNRFETKVANWLTSEIVFTDNLEERSALVSRLVDVMLALKDLNNFAGLFVVNAAFESASVFRLKHTFKALSLKRQHMLEEMKQIASRGKNYAFYKEKLRSINPPCVPFVGMYLTWIVFIKEGNENKIQGKPDHFINFKKRRKIADVCQEIQQYQNTPYCLTQELSIQEYMLCQDPLGDLSHNQWEEMVYEHSKVLEPKDQSALRAPRKFKFDLRPPQEKSWQDTFIRRKQRHQAQASQVFSDGDGTLLSDSSSPVGSKGSISSPPSSPTSISSSVLVSPAGSVNIENGFSPMEKRGRHNSEPGPGPTPPRPPKPHHMKALLSMIDLPPIPEPPTHSMSSPSSFTSSSSPTPDNDRPPVLPPKPNSPGPKGYGKERPPLPIPQAGPPLPPRDKPIRKQPPPPPLPPRGVPGR